LAVVNPFPVTSEVEKKCGFRRNLLEESAGLGRASCLFIVAPPENLHLGSSGFVKDYYVPWTKPECEPGAVSACSLPKGICVTVAG